MADNPLQDLFRDQLKDIYHAEKQILKALPKMAEAAQSDELRAGLKQHCEQTEQHLVRLERIFGMLGKPARGKTCEAILGMVQEGEQIMHDYKGSELLDAGLVAAAQAVEHYEIARYGTLKAWAAQLGLDEAVPLLEATLGEETATEEKLARLAEEDANRKAA